MRFSLNIDYPLEKMDANKQRMQARNGFKYTDRVPVLFCLAPRYFAPIFGIDYRDFFKDVETQYYWQLQFAKYRIENMPDDFCQDSIIYVSPYFDNITNADAFGAEIGWSDNETPRAIPIIKHVEEIDGFEIPEPTAGLWGKVLEWWFQMRELARKTEITFNGRKGNVEVALLAIGGEGPHMTAIDLVGEKFYCWMLEYPESCHNLLDKITKGMLQAETNYRRIDPRYRPAYGIAEDAAQIMSPELVKKFCVLYDNLLFERFGNGLADGRGMHMCGNSTHLHKVLIEDLKITSFNLFGYQVEPKIVAKNLGGRVYLWGNINPMLMLNGSNEEIKEVAMECLATLAPYGGFILGDGANVCPGTPIENMAMLIEAAVEYGLPDSVYD